MMRGLHLCIVTFMLALLAGCASDMRTGYEGEPPGTDQTPTPTPTDPGKDPGDDTTPVVDEEACILLPSSHGDLFMGENSAFGIGVYVYSAGDGKALGNVPVSYRIESTSTTGGELSSLRQATDARGLSEVNLLSREGGGTIVVRASVACAEPIFIEVDVIPIPLGNLVVNFTYGSTSVYEIKPIHADVLLGDTALCSKLTRGSNPPGELRTGTTPTVAGTIAYNNLPVGTPYTVVGWGLGQYGELAAWGCTDAVVTEEGVVTTATVHLQLLPLDPVGIYDVRANWDFTNALASSGTVGQVIAQISNVFDNPGAGLYDVIFTVLEAQFGSFIGGAIRTVLDLFGLDTVLQNAINSVVGSVPFLQDLQTIGQDITQVVKNLEVIQKWEIIANGSEFGNEGFSGYNGYEDVVGIALYWRYGCSPTDPACGRFDIVADTAELGTLSGDWEGYVMGYNQFRINNHPIDVNYGRVILYALENLMLPAIIGRPGPVTLEQVVADVVGCGRLGDSVAGGNNQCRFSDGLIGSLIGCICDSEATCASKCKNSSNEPKTCTGIEDTCAGFINNIFGNVLNNLIYSLELPSLLQAHGSMTLVNTNDDRKVERLSNGIWNGSVTIDGNTQSVPGTFSGTRRATP